jgi:predicted nucleotidyltransferase component of viral defense system
MLTRPQVQRYSTESGLRDIMIAEKEVVLTFLLQLLSERGILDRLAFKGGTCLRKIFVGSCRAALKTENFGNGVGLLHLNRIRAQAPCT